jgi:hypothetical protein
VRVIFFGGGPAACCLFTRHTTHTHSAACHCPVRQLARARLLPPAAQNAPKNTVQSHEPGWLQERATGGRCNNPNPNPKTRSGAPQPALPPPTCASQRLRPPSFSTRAARASDSSASRPASAPRRPSSCAPIPSMRTPSCVLRVCAFRGDGGGGGDGGTRTSEELVSTARACACIRFKPCVHECTTYTACALHACVLQAYLMCVSRERICTCCMCVAAHARQRTWVVAMRYESSLLVAPRVVTSAGQEREGGAATRDVSWLM